MLQKMIATTEHRRPATAHVTVSLPTETIGWIIGKGGKNIRHTERTFGVRISIDRSTSHAKITGNPVNAGLARTYFKAKTHGIRVGDELTVKVTRVSDFAVFAEIGLVSIMLHCAEVPRERFDAIKEGDTLRVIVKEGHDGYRFKSGLAD